MENNINYKIESTKSKLLEHLYVLKNEVLIRNTIDLLTAISERYILVNKDFVKETIKKNITQKPLPFSNLIEYSTHFGFYFNYLVNEKDLDIFDSDRIMVDLFTKQLKTLFEKGESK